MSNLLTVIVVGVLSYVVVRILRENDKLKVEIEKLEDYKVIYEGELKERARVLKDSLAAHNNEVKWYKSIIRELEQQLKDQSNPINNRIKWIKEQLEEKSDVIDEHNKEYNDLLDELRRAQNQK